jgi:predicted Zn finger-like uncharacterized protein
MIIQCEKCGKKFDLDESLLKDGGSRVRCSLCKHVFMAYPAEPVFLEEIESLEPEADEPDNTLVQDSPPLLDEAVTESELKGQDLDFEDVFDELPDIEEIESASDAAQERRGRSRSRLLFLLILLVLIGSGAAIVHWAADLIPLDLPFLRPAEKKTASDPGSRRLSLEDVDGGFVDSEKSGKLFVIRGIVVNNYPKPRSFIRVKVSILDDQGRAAKIKVVYAGNTFKEEELKTLSMKEIDRALKRRSGINKNNFNVAPGASVPFMTVFGALPDSVSEFEVGAVSSSPGA